MTTPMERPTDPGALPAAAAIGDRLVAEAIWSGRYCNWIGAQPVDLRHDTGGLVYRALGPDLYGGTAGVAVFLAQLAVTAGQPGYRATALAALRHAVAHQDDITVNTRLGFYTGWAGLGAAALRIGRLLDSEEFAAAGSGLLQQVLRRLDPPGPGDDTEFDLMAGVAGAAVALAFAARVTGDEAYATGAARAAARLIGTAHRRRTGWSWASPAWRHKHDLLGLSHGAAGVAVGLIEAYRSTGELRFAAAAHEAMRYEDRWLDPAEGNWPDFRENPVDRHTVTYANLWCHGAPGIALSRLHAIEHLDEARWRDDAEIAIATTEAATRRLVDSGGADFSLCHGLAGTAESIVEGHRLLGRPADTAWLVAEHGLTRYGRAGVPWPCGTHTAETPNLMLGLAGIGYFYLRQADGRVPSVLLPVRWDR
jgi:class II lanthipeptide synthase